MRWQIPFGALIVASLFGCGESDGQAGGSTGPSGGSAGMGGSGSTSGAGGAGGSAGGGASGDGGASTGGSSGVGGAACQGVTACSAGDGCCPSSCAPSDDSDCTGVAWFVDQKASGAQSGTSWQDAWTDTTDIEWNAIQPGDRIYLSGGSSGESYGAFSVAASGTAEKRITLYRATDPGHDGVVTLQAPLEITGSFVAIDGMSWRGIVLLADSAAGGGGGGAVWMTGDDIVLRNIRFEGNYAAGGAYHTVAGSPALDTLRIEYCDFYKTVGEDHINWQGSGTLSVDHCVFTTPDPPGDGSHRDLMNPWTGPGGYDFYFTHSIVYGLASNGFAFLFQDPGQVGNIHISYNVFSSLPYVVRFGSGNSGATSIEMHNNVFHETTAQQGSGPYGGHRNEIFYGPSLTGDPVMGGSTGSDHCLWFNADDFEPGTGNLDGEDPLFLDVTNPLGPDGVPFTDDDGFALSAGSPATDAGGDAGELVDIRGKPISGAPDIGAYETQP
jgi:hypothetical protein